VLRLTGFAARCSVCGDRVSTEQIGEREVGAAVAPFVVATRVARGDQTPAAFDEGLHCRRLCRRDGRNVRQD
jgi:hypothetical protein